MFFRSIAGASALVGVFWISLILGALMLSRGAPSLQYIALVGGFSQAVQLFDGGRGAVVTLLPRLERTPVNAHWSPDGAYLGMVMQQGNRYDYWIYQPSTGDTTVVLRDLLRPALPTWSHDAGAIAYQDAELNICTLDVADFGGGASHCTLLRGQLPPAWSQDGARLAVVNLGPVVDGSRQISIMAREGQIIAEPRVAATAINDLAWSPDTARIAFSGRGADGDRWFLDLLDLRTGDVRPLIADVGYIFDLAWSPESRRLALVMSRSQQHGRQRDVYVIDPDADGAASAPRRITDNAYDEMYLRWVDESRLSFMVQEYGYARAVLVDLAAPDLVTISEALAPASYTLWRP